MQFVFVDVDAAIYIYETMEKERSIAAKMKSYVSMAVAEATASDVSALVCIDSDLWK